MVKQKGDSLLSGSFVVSGNCAAQVDHVGADNYAQKIAGDAGYIKKRNSEIMDSIDFIVKIIGFAILPIGGLLFWKQYFVLHDTFQNSVVSTAAAMVGMIPEGLVLLISLAFAVSVIKLSARKTPGAGHVLHRDAGPGGHPLPGPRPGPSPRAPCRWTSWSPSTATRRRR